MGAGEEIGEEFHGVGAEDGDVAVGGAWGVGGEGEGVGVVVCWRLSIRCSLIAQYVLFYAVDVVEVLDCGGLGGCEVAVPAVPVGVGASGVLVGRDVGGLEDFF